MDYYVTHCYKVLPTIFTVEEGKDGAPYLTSEVTLVPMIIIVIPVIFHTCWNPILHHTTPWQISWSLTAPGTLWPPAWLVGATLSRHCSYNRSLSEMQNINPCNISLGVQWNNQYYGESPPEQDLSPIRPSLAIWTPSLPYLSLALRLPSLTFLSLYLLCPNISIYMIHVISLHGLFCDSVFNLDFPPPSLPHLLHQCQLICWEESNDKHTMSHRKSLIICL